MVVLKSYVIYGFRHRIPFKTETAIDVHSASAGTPAGPDAQEHTFDRAHVNDLADLDGTVFHHGVKFVIADP